MDINIDKLKHGFKIAIENLASQSQVVDDLNVFPVPDGDTGTNMTMTIKSALSTASSHDNKADFLKNFNKGALLGARGNSGVILSQIIGGFLDIIVDNLGSIDNKVISKAFESSADRAYKSVMSPVEGTILTVIKDMSISAKENEDKNLSVIEYLETIYQDGVLSLNNTPNVLPVLKEAGVVDAGGKGLIILLEGFLKWLHNDTADINLVETINQDQKDQIEEEIKFGYCTEFLITVNPEELNNIEMSLKSDLKDRGDSILVVGIDDTIKVHLHTERPGKVLDLVQNYGPLSGIDIDNMRLQAASRNESKDAEIKEHKDIGIITVAAGPGFKEIFNNLGVDVVIYGGQTMNPSTKEFLDAVEEVDADNIYILPNNKNIIMAVEQVVGLTDKNVFVVPTTSIPEGIHSILNLDQNKTGKDNIEELKDALKEIKTGEITFAVRDTTIKGEHIKKGQAIGIHEGDIVTKGTNPNLVAEELLDSIVGDNDSFITIYYGHDIEESEAVELEDHIISKFDDFDIQLISGGQPLYYYIISVE